MLYGDNNSSLTRANYEQQAGITNFIFSIRLSPHPAQGRCGATMWTGGCCGMSREGRWPMSMQMRGCGSMPSARTPSSPRSCRYCQLPAPSHTWLVLLWCAQGHSSHFTDPNGCPRSQMLCFPSSQTQNHVTFHSDFSLLGVFTTTVCSPDWRLCASGILKPVLV